MQVIYKVKDLKELILPAIPLISKNFETRKERYLQKTAQEKKFFGLATLGEKGALKKFQKWEWPGERYGRSWDEFVVLGVMRTLRYKCSTLQDDQDIILSDSEIYELAKIKILCAQR